MSRIDQINELLRAELAHLISTEIEFVDGLVTVAEVKTSADLKNATVVISVLPENLSGTALRVVRKQSGHITKKLKKLNLKYIPRLRWRIDSNARHAANMDKAFEEVSKS